jgi:hypothetical protein
MTQGGMFSIPLGGNPKRWSMRAPYDETCGGRASGSYPPGSNESVFRNGNLSGTRGTPMAEAASIMLYTGCSYRSVAKGSPERLK